MGGARWSLGRAAQDPTPHTLPGAFPSHRMAVDFVCVCVCWVGVRGSPTYAKALSDDRSYTITQHETPVPW